MNKVIAYKGFDTNWQCRGFHYQIGETYEHEGSVKACSFGFHSCEYPLDVFSYYAPATSVFACVEASGEISRDSDGSKVASARISITAQLTIPDLVTAAVQWIMDRLDKSEDATEVGTGDYSVATNTGYRSAATNTGSWSAATNTGDCSAATNTGDRSAATNTGDCSAATAEGEHSVAASLGRAGRAKASAGSALVLVYRGEYGEIVHIRAAVAGRDGVKPNVFYTLNAEGEFVEVQS